MMAVHLGYIYWSASRVISTKCVEVVWGSVGVVCRNFLRARVFWGVEYRQVLHTDHFTAKNVAKITFTAKNVAKFG